jgi:hypothetical protein
LEAVAKLEEDYSVVAVNLAVESSGAVNLAAVNLAAGKLELKPRKLEAKS